MQTENVLNEINKTFTNVQQHLNYHRPGDQRIEKPADVSEICLDDSVQNVDIRIVQYVLEAIAEKMERDIGVKVYLEGRRL